LPYFVFIEETADWHCSMQVTFATPLAAREGPSTAGRKEGRKEGRNTRHQTVRRQTAALREAGQERERSNVGEGRRALSLDVPAPVMRTLASSGIPPRRTLSIE